MASKVVPTGASHFLPEGVLFGGPPLHQPALPFYRGAAAGLGGQPAASDTLQLSPCRFWGSL